MISVKANLLSWGRIDFERRLALLKQISALKHTTLGDVTCLPNVNFAGVVIRTQKMGHYISGLSFDA